MLMSSFKERCYINMMYFPLLIAIAVGPEKMKPLINFAVLLWFRIGHHI